MLLLSFCSMSVYIAVISGKVSFDSITQCARVFSAYPGRTVAPLKDRVAKMQASNGTGKRVLLTWA